MNCHIPLASNFPTLALGEILLWERSPVFSSLAASDNKYFLLAIFVLVVSIGLTPTKRRTQVSGNSRRATELDKALGGEVGAGLLVSTQELSLKLKGFSESKGADAVKLELFEGSEGRSHSQGLRHPTDLGSNPDLTRD